MSSHARLASLLVAAAALLHAAPVLAQGPRVGWFAQGDVGFNLTSGNTETSSLAFKLDATRSWLRTEFKVSAGGIRSNAQEAAGGLPALFAVGTEANIVRNTNSVPTAANYFAHADLMRRITERLFYKAGGDYERDRFSGIDSRVIGRAGLGYLFASRAETRFSVSLDGTFTAESSTITDPTGQAEENFPGLRLQADLDKKFGRDRRNTYTSKLMVDENLSYTEDVRTQWINSLAVDMNRYLALKTEVQLRHDNRPAFVEIPFFTANPVAGARPLRNVAGAAEKLDTLFRVSVVINFTPGRSGDRATP